MRHPHLLVIAATSVFASPFHMGASWEWVRQETRCSASLASGPLVCDRYDMGALSASVIDSMISSTGSGTLWKIRLVDTLMRTWGDTADTAILEQFSATGKARWIRGSAFLPLEPRPYDSLEERTAPLDPSHPWGDGWTAGILDSTGSLVQNESEYIWLNYEKSLDWMHSLRWDSHFGWVSGSFGHMRFTLAFKDGRAAPDTKDLFGRSAQIPLPSNVFLWEEVKSSNSVLYPAGPDPKNSRSVEFVRWTFQESLTDSGDWMRANVKEVRTRDGKDSTSDLALRWNWRTAEVLPKPIDEMCKDLSAGFWTDGFGQDLGGFQVLDDTSHVKVISEFYRGYHSRTRLSGGLDSSVCRTLRVGHHGDYGGSLYSTTIRLLQVDDSVIRQPSSTDIKIRAARSVTGIGDLRALALRYPSASVIVHDAKGAAQTMRLDQLVERRAAPRLGLRWLEVQLPDGSVRRGSMVL